MGNAVNLKDIQYIADLKNGLARFGKSSEQSLAHVEHALRRVGEELQRKLLADQRELERCIENVHYSQRAIDDCEAQEEDDYIPDCSEEYDDLSGVRRAQQEAEAELNETRRWKRRVEKQIDDYRLMAARLKRLATQRTGQAMSMLQRKIGEAEQYIAATPDEPGAIASVGGESIDESIYAPDMGVETLAGGQAAHTTNTNITLTGVAPAWKEHGVVTVDLDKLPDVEDIFGAEDFMKVSMKDMKAGLKRFQEMGKVIESGQGNNKEYWAKKDRQRGLDYPNGYQRIYEAFYGREPIRITKNGNQYTIENGRHRVWMAKKMGIKSLPVSLVEKESG